MNRKITFDETATQPVFAVVLIVDLQGFSEFCSRPDVLPYVPKFLNCVFGELETFFWGGTIKWPLTGLELETDDLWRPTFSKYLGDGALYVWPAHGKSTVSQAEINSFLPTLCFVQRWIHEVEQVLKFAIDAPVVGFPTRVRFGLAAGSVYRLRYKGSKECDYVGYAINLASRLQSYCKGLGFIASGRLSIPRSVLEENGFIKVIAKKLRGLPDELVIVDSEGFHKLPEKERKVLFELVPPDY